MNPSDTLPPELAEPLAGAYARLGSFGRHVTWYPMVSSTSDVASALAEGGAPEGVVVVANAQSAGRGRHGRVWASPPGAGLYVSVVLRPGERIIPMVTIAAGVAVVEGIRAATGLRSQLKWPNDVYLGPRKVAGVFAEAGATAGGGLTIGHVVLGLGINVMPAAYPQTLPSAPRVSRASLAAASTADCCWPSACRLSPSVMPTLRRGASWG